MENNGVFQVKYMALRLSQLIDFERKATCIRTRYSQDRRGRLRGTTAYIQESSTHGATSFCMQRVMTTHPQRILPDYRNNLRSTEHGSSPGTRCLCAPSTSYGLEFPRERSSSGEELLSDPWSMTSALPAFVEED